VVRVIGDRGPDIDFSAAVQSNEGIRSVVLPAIAVPILQLRRFWITCHAVVNTSAASTDIGQRQFHELFGCPSPREYNATRAAFINSDIINGNSTVINGPIIIKVVSVRVGCTTCNSPRIIDPCTIVHDGPETSNNLSCVLLSKQAIFLACV